MPDRPLVATVVGARPQFVKAAMVSAALEAEGIAELLVHTGQHYDDAMSQSFFNDLGLRPADVNLGVGSGPHGQQTARMLEGVEAVLVDHAPRAVIVHGDTNSTLAGALAAAKLSIPVAHVEAGLRSFNRAMPEELNRVVTDHLSDLCLAPTDVAVANLAREGISGSAVELVGDVMFDAALRFGDEAARSELVPTLGLGDSPYILVTVHRAENTDDRARLAAIVGALVALAERIRVVWPVHPRTAGALAEAGLELEGVEILDPVGYLDMVSLERHARLIATDSGGVQKEAFFHGVRCVTLRDETEWTELVHAGWNTVVPPTSSAAIVDAVTAALDAGLPPDRPELYGSGRAAQLIARAVRRMV